MNSVFLLRVTTIVSTIALGILLPLRAIQYFDLSQFDYILFSLLAFNRICNFFILKTQQPRTLSFKLEVMFFFLMPFLGYFRDNNFIFIATSIWLVKDLRYIYSILDEYSFLKPITYRLVPLSLLMPMIVHTLACCWIFLGSGTAGIESDKYLEYVRAIYWTFTTLTTVGYGDISAKTPEQMLFTCLVQITGVGVFGFILSNVASILARADAARENHMNNLDKIDTFMRQHRTPHSLQTRVRSYYHYLWKNKMGYQDQSLIMGLPAKLQTELYVHINRSILNKVPFLKEASTELIEELMTGLKTRICVPGENVFKIGDAADGLYSIHQGEVNVISKENTTIANLKEGSFFGEMALIQDRQRNATIVANEFCDLYFLDKSDFHKVVNKHPEFLAHLEKVVNLRQVS